jgi:DNA polymerase-1
LYLTPTKDHWACDIEADNLLADATRIWCATLFNIETKERVKCLTQDDFLAFQTANPDTVYVGHNFLAYDAPMLRRFWNAKLPVTHIVDTFVLSQLYNPSLKRPKGLTGKKNPHGLEAWGLRLRYPKGDFSDFSAYSPAMLKYCMRDSMLTALLYKKLSERMTFYGFTEEGCKLEHRAWAIIQNKQRVNGFPFNYEQGHKLYVQLRARQEELKNEIYTLWPPELRCVAEYKQARKKDGTYTKGFVEHRGKFPKLEEQPDGTYLAYDWVSFNLGSPDQRVAKLLELGWEPTRLTKKTPKGGGGNPKVDEEALLEFAETSGKKELLALAKWVVIFSRANNLKTWLDAYNDKTGAIHGQLFLNSTLRYRHSNPNSANIPAVRTKKLDGKDVIQYGEDGGYSYESRDLWTCGDPEKYRLVGIDGKGIQLRVLANYAYSEEFVERVLDGDPHTNNIKILGLANKAAAKKFLYTTLMGGGGELLAADQIQFGTRLTTAEGNRLKNILIDSVPGFRELIKSLQRELRKHGRIKLCDGTPIIVPSDHMVIPYLLQGDESRLMKLAMVFLEYEVGRAGMAKGVFKAADIHDEWQYVVRKEMVDDFIRLALGCFPRAGNHFKYRVPIEGDAKVGLTWAETH